MSPAAGCESPPPVNSIRTANVPVIPKRDAPAPSYVRMGLGCGAFGYGLGGMVNSRVIRNNPQLKRQLEIEQNDERNIALSNRAKAKAYDAMLYVFGALMVAFAIMGVEMPAVLLLVAAYLFAVGYFIFHLNRYNRQM